jgi:hypothetical protein
MAAFVVIVLFCMQVVEEKELLENRTRDEVTHSLTVGGVIHPLAEIKVIDRPIRSRRSSPTHTMAKCTCAVNHSVTGADLSEKNSFDRVTFKWNDTEENNKVGKSIPRKVRQCFETRKLQVSEFNCKITFNFLHTTC